jgi:hypothetical protein
MHKKIIFLISVVFFISSCSNTFDSVKRGITGAKSNSSDEFLIKKKDPLTLPPDFENLPTPEDGTIAQEEIAIFENVLETATEDTSSGSNSTEGAILDKIKRR